MQKRTRYAQVGLGGRHEMFRDAVSFTYSDSCEMVGLCDTNDGRLDLSARQLKEQNGPDVPKYKAADFDRMIAETKPDCVIVTSRDSTHDEYICRAMELGCDVITEKPMTIDANRCRKIIETKKKTGRKVTVTFNYRYSPPRTQMKDLLMSGIIGDVLSVDFHWMLDIHHGADYFRRWHRNKSNSGGLMVHKATHHFDLVNWWLGTVPETVYASGHRKFYTPATAHRLGLAGRGERCHGCPAADRCTFKVSLKDNKNLREMYLECELFDGYIRDQCVFSDKIDIEDSMNLVVGYASGAKMTYSLNSYMPWEGYVISFNGTKGRIEHKCEETVYINADGTIPGALKKEGTWIKVYLLAKPAYEIPVWKAEGGHGGADPVMLKYIFAPDKCEPDKYRRASDERGGAWSILTGIAANKSIAEGRAVKVKDLVPGLELPDLVKNSSG